MDLGSPWVSMDGSPLNSSMDLHDLQSICSVVLLLVCNSAVVSLCDPQHHLVIFVNREGTQRCTDFLMTSFSFHDLRTFFDDRLRLLSTYGTKCKAVLVLCCDRCILRFEVVRN